MSIPGWIRTTLNPDFYHGSGKKRPFFEGWYFKLVDSNQARRIAVIPGVSRGENPSEDHAFVQLLDGETGKSKYHPYPIDNFYAARDKFQIEIGQNRFSKNGIHLDIASQDQSVRGDLRFEGLTPWPVSMLSPGIMGPYAWIPLMECYHGVVSLDHTIHGSIHLDGETIDFTDGTGYTEKDWGRSFPAAYVWFQSNHFQTPRTCLTASIAIIPWVRQAFPGLIVGLWLHGKLYRFATYTGARVENLKIGDQDVDWVVIGGNLRLEMTARRAFGGLLHAPTLAGMQGRISETMNSSVNIRLLERRGKSWVTLFEETGEVACLEAAGDLTRLVKMWAGTLG